MKGNRINHPKKYKDGRKRWTEPRRIAYMKEYMKTVYHERKKDCDRNYQRKIKTEIRELLGNKCCICGYSGLALQVDHVNNNGAEERKKHGAGSSYWCKILREVRNSSKDYQLLCANCNMEKELRGGLP